MYATYPKASANPSSSVGEQHVGNWIETPKVRYPGGGAAATVYNGDRSHTKVCKGGSGGPAPATYPSKAPEKFGTVKMSTN
jgi:hypothetical protein